MFAFDCLDFGIFFFIKTGVHFVDFGQGAVSIILLFVLHGRFVGVCDEKGLVHVCCTVFNYFQADVVMESGDEEL